MFTIRKKKECENKEKSEAPASEGMETSAGTTENDVLSDSEPDSEIDSDSDSDSQSSSESDPEPLPDTVNHEETGPENDTGVSSLVAIPLKDRIVKWLEDKNLDAEEQKTMISVAGMIDSSMNEVNADEAMFDVLLKGVRYDRAIAEAEERGEIRGRNASIEELTRSEIDGDGVPHLASRGICSDRTPSIFELARSVRN